MTMAEVRPMRNHLAACVVFSLAVFGLTFAQSTFGDEPKYVSSENSCHQCHRSPQGNDEARGVTNWILKRETEIWETQDMHSRAFDALKPENELARSMGELLNINPQTDIRCLNCHATNINAENSLDLSEREIQEELAGGVTCQACHGPASLYAQVHQGDVWRGKTRAEKEALGLYDLHDPVKLAERCLSCHVGNADEGKVLTHEMHAAGHPPLPSFELEAFLTRMPKHWHDPKPQSPQLAELPPEIQAEYVDPQGADSRRVLIGGVIALRNSLRLMADEADKAHAGGVDEANEPITWPRLAHFDCYACHHELEQPGWRQERGYVLTPGRPPPRYWPLPVVKLALSQAEGIDVSQAHSRLQTQLNPLYDVLNARPFGDPAKISPATAEVEKSLEKLIAALATNEPLDDGQSLRLLRGLTALTADELVDFDSARQVAWAFRVMYDDLESKPSSDADIQQTLSELDGLLNLSRFQSPNRSNRQSIAERLAEDLRPIGEYDARRFQAHMRRLQELLAGV